MEPGCVVTVQHDATSRIDANRSVPVGTDSARDPYGAVVQRDQVEG